MNPQRWIGTALIGLGLVILLVRAVGGSGWPLFIVGPGLALLAVAFVGPRHASGLAVPGAIVTTVGTILALQAWTGRFETWAYAWGLVMASVGAGTFLHASLQGNDKEQREGLRLVTLGLAFFAGFGAFFELAVFGSALRGAFGWIVGVIAIAIGVVLLRRSGPDREGVG